MPIWLLSDLSTTTFLSLTVHSVLISKQRFQGELIILLDIQTWPGAQQPLPVQSLLHTDAPELVGWDLSHKHM